MGTVWGDYAKAKTGYIRGYLRYTFVEAMV